ncbi:Acylamino-acid-releasing enzyme [Minicystis rosea]|nr:Acylamino-acid-releasing enzyme [Minicystis rosea]
MLLLPGILACSSKPKTSAGGAPRTVKEAAAVPASGTSSPTALGAPRARGAKRACEIADYFRRAGVGEPNVSPDGTRMVFTVSRQDLKAGEGWSEIWIADIDGSHARALTTAKKYDLDPSFSPDGQTLLFVSNRSGSLQLWTMPVAGGEPKALTSFAPGLESPVWAPDGKRIAAVSSIFPEHGIDEQAHLLEAKGIDEGKLRVHLADALPYRHWTSWNDGRRAHIVLVDATSGAVLKDLTPGPWESPTFQLGGGRGFAFSPDGKELAYTSNHEGRDAESTNSDVFIVQVDTTITETSAVNLTEPNKGWDGAPLYSPDGLSIAYISQATPGYESDLKRLAVLDRATRTTRYLTSREGFDDMVDDMRWTKGSSALLFRAERLGRTPLFEIPRQGGEPEAVLTDGHIGGFEVLADGTIIYARSRVSEPGEIYRAKNGTNPQRVTYLNAALEEEIDFRPAEEMWVDGEGNYRIQVFLVKPHDFDPAKKYPLVLNVHGGPQQQWTDSFRGDWQIYPAKGYVVAFANPTGSTGHGQPFTDAITGDYGGRVFRDLMKVTDVLERLPYVDADRLGLMGWSFGGYMSMWIEGHTDRYKCNAAMMGIFDMPSFYGATDELWFPEHDQRGTPWTSDDYVRWSPSMSVRSFKTPALVITGERDFRCPYTQSLGYFTALQKMGVPSRLVVYPNAGHWPSWYEMAFYYDVHLDFFHQYLGGEPAPYDVKQFARNQVVFQDSAAPRARP